MSTPRDDSQGRRRRRAVGPAPSGAGPSERDAGVAGWPATGWADPDELLAADDDERLLRDVPPHHGG